MFDKIEVGDKIIDPCVDCTKFDISAGGATLLVAWRNPTPKEIEGFKGQIEFREIILNDVIFITVKPQGLNWFDAPYHKDLSKGTISTVPPEEGMGLGIHLLLINAANGKLIYQRYLGLSTKFTQRLYADIESQGKIDLAYQQRINMLYAKYSTDRLAQLSQNRCKFQDPTK